MRLSFMGSVIAAALAASTAIAYAQTSTSASTYSQSSASAQPAMGSATTPSAEAVMPALYNANGLQANDGNTAPLPAGTYYLGPDPSTSASVTYYGNGVYYIPSRGAYGGSSANDPNGTAGVPLGYPASVLNAGGSAAAPTSGVPNTGLGGVASANWLILIASGIAVLAGLFYVGREIEKGRATANA